MGGSGGCLERGGVRRGVSEEWGEGDRSLSLFSLIHIFVELNILSTSLCIMIFLCLPVFHWDALSITCLQAVWLEAGMNEFKGRMSVGLPTALRRGEGR